MRKMVQPRYWVIQLVLLCQLWQLGSSSFRGTEYSGLGIYQKAEFISEEDIGELLFFCLFVIIGEIGKKLDKGYICPVYCEVNHKHRIIEYEIKTKQGTNEKTDQELDGPAIIADR